jgi:putative nucleotidyltransferase with HDIG domain
MSATDADPTVEALLGDSLPRAERPLSARERCTELILGGLMLGAVAAMAEAFSAGPGFDAWTALILVVVYAIAERVQFDIGGGYTVPTQVVFVPMLLLLPTPYVPLFVAAGLLLGRLPDYLRRRTHPDRVLLVLSDTWHAVGAALVLCLAGYEAPSFGSWTLVALALGGQVVFDALFATIRGWLELGVPPALQLRMLGWVFLVDAALAPVGLLVALAAVHEPAAPLMVLPLLGVIELFAREREERIRHTLALSQAYRGTALLMSDLLEADDAYTGGEHTQGVVALSLAVGDELGLRGRDRRNLEFGALLHDIGKIRVADAIINKPGRLDEEEMEIVRRHPIDGQEMLERVGGVLADVGEIVRHHHERWDGDGYPDGLMGEQIPMESRIIGACDAFSAMTTHRSYQAARPAVEALAELHACAGTQFDPRVVTALATVVMRACPSSSDTWQALAARDLVPVA